MSRWSSRPRRRRGGESATFRKELGPVSLTLTQVMYVVGSGWVGTAAKLGPTHVVFWSFAILLFYLPQAAVVIHLRFAPSRAEGASMRRRCWTAMQVDR